MCAHVRWVFPGLCEAATHLTFSMTPRASVSWGKIDWLRYVRTLSLPDSIGGGGECNGGEDILLLHIEFSSALHDIYT